MTTIRKIILGTALAASAVTVAAPASARDYYGHRGGNDTAVAIGAGVIGLALGAAIASSSHRGYDDGYTYSNGGWYEGYQYRNGGFYDRDGYRRYDRRSWDHRHHHDRDDYRGQYGNGYNRGDYTGGYNNYNGYNGYNGYSYGYGY